MAFAIWQGFITDKKGEVLDQASVTVEPAAGGTVKIYKDKDGAEEKVNPFLTSIDGKAEFYATPGTYKITATKGSLTSFFNDVRIGIFNNELDDITSLADINTAALVDGQQFKRREFWPGTGVGAADIYWDPNEPVANHTGGTIIDPAKISELDTGAKTFGTYFTADTVSGNTGCFVVSEGADAASYGAVNDGSTDCTLPIQAAIDSLSSVGGPDGVYIVSDPDSDDNCLTMSSGAKLKFGGKHKATIKQASGTNARNTVSILEDADNVSIEGVTIDPDRDNNTVTNTRGISGSRGCSNVRVNNVHIANAAGESIQTNSDDNMHDADDAMTPFADGIEIKGVSVSNGGTKAVQVRRTKNVICRLDDIDVDARVGEDSASGFECANAKNVVCFGSNITQVQSDRGPGFRVVNGCENILAIGGTVSGGRQALFISDSQQVTMKSITGNNPGAEGVSIDNTDPGSNGYITKNVTLEDIKIVNPNGNGCNVRVALNGTEVSNVNILNSFFIGGASMPIGISSRDNVGGQTLSVRELNNTISGASLEPVEGMFVPIERSGLGNLYSYSVLISDDDVFSFSLPEGTQNGILEAATEGGSGLNVAGACVYRADGTASTSSLYNGDPAKLEFSTGALTGITGTDGVTTVSVDNAGVAYLENRTGAERMYAISVRVAV